MPRTVRIDIPGQLYHITEKTSNGKAKWQNKSDDDGNSEKGLADALSHGQGNRIDLLIGTINDVHQVAHIPFVTEAVGRLGRKSDYGSVEIGHLFEKIDARLCIQLVAKLGSGFQVVKLIFSKLPILEA
jgi:hypothetical protein